MINAKAIAPAAIRPTHHAKMRSKVRSSEDRAGDCGGGEEDSAELGDGDWTGRGISLRMEMRRHYKNDGDIFGKR